MRRGGTRSGGRGPAAPAGRVALGAALAVSLLLAGCGPEPEAEPRWNVILLLVDTLRADHLSSYGYARPTSPNLDAFAAANVRFEDARSQAACTFPSVNSLLTSRHPLLFVDQPPGEFGIPPETPSLAEYLGERGYRTIAVSGSKMIRKSPSPHNPNGGFDRGFDVFDEFCVGAHAACINRVGLELIDGGEEPFLLYLHYLEPHAPYGPPVDFERPFSTGLENPGAAAPGAPHMLSRAKAKTGRVKANEVEYLIALYDDEIAYFDREFGKLLGELDGRGLLDRSILIIASDHGEAFHERDYFGHCLTPLFEAMTVTPLVMRIPGVESDGPVGAPVENMDIVPTVLDYLGVDVESLGLDGRSLRPLLEGVAEPDPYTYTLQNAELAVSDERFTLSYNARTKSYRLYDRVRDPYQRRRLSPTEVEDSEELRRKLLSWIGSVGSEALKPLEGTRDVEAELRALGYLR